MGVFASRSPFRPNPIGLSSVKLLSLDIRKDVGPVLVVSGADMMDGTPIYDIKPYIAYADSHPDATGGFTDKVKARSLEVVFPEKLKERVPEEKLDALIGVLSQDPRPRYQDDSERIYGMSFANLDVKFRCEGERLFVLDIVS